MMTLLISDALRALREQLPPLIFNPAQDGSFAASEWGRVYSEHYHLSSLNPPDGQEGLGYIDAAGFRIAVHYWLPAQARGSLVVVHGYYDHTGIFNKAVAFGLEHGLAVLAFDLPGHGLSSGEPAAIDSFDQYADVLAELLQQSRQLMPSPWYGLGQSTGCSVLLNYLWRYVATGKATDPFAKLALCAPLVVPRGWRGWQLGSTVYRLLRPFIRQLGRGGANSSHDSDFNDFIMQRDPLQAKYLSLRWVGAMSEWHQFVLQCQPLEKPLLIVQGTADKTVDWRYNLPLLQARLPRAQVAWIPGAKHQLVNESEPYRQLVFDTIRQYFFETL